MKVGANKNSIKSARAAAPAETAKNPFAHIKILRPPRHVIRSSNVTTAEIDRAIKRLDRQ